MSTAEIAPEIDQSNEIVNTASKIEMLQMRTDSTDLNKTDSDVTSHQTVNFAPSPDERPIEFVAPAEGTPAAEALAGV